MPRTSAWSWPSPVSSPAISRHRPVKRYGPGGSGEPPMPGGSNLITSTAGSTAAANGSRASRRAPMPLISRNGGRGGEPTPFVPGLTATLSRCRPTVTVRTSAAVGIRVLGDAVPDPAAGEHHVQEHGGAEPHHPVVVVERL